MSYKLTAGDVIRRIADNALIPQDAKNRDYRAYLQWVNDGGVPSPIDPPTAEELAIAEQVAKDVLDVSAAKAYGKLTALKAMTPAQVQSWVAANVTNLAQAQDAIATLAIGVSILARRL